MQLLGNRKYVKPSFRIEVRLFLMLISVTRLSSQVIEDASAGEFAIDFIFVDNKGEERALSDYIGEFVDISFWASWCKLCIEGFERYKDVRRDASHGYHNA